MRYLFIIVVMSLLMMLPAQAMADIAVIVHPSSEISELTRRQVVDIYMGRTVVISNGKTLVPYDKPENSIIRANFYHRLVGKSVASVNAYWARLLFTGRASPPRLVSDRVMMLETIENKPNSIGYVKFEDLNSNVKMVFRIKVNE